jgi:hypothetical protein
MPQISSSRRRRTPMAAAIFLAVLASLVLAACGSSSSSTTAASASAAKSSTGGATGAAGDRFSALRECLQKNGITLPKLTPGKRPAPGAGGFFGGAGGAGTRALPKGVTRAQYETALKKCGGFAGRGFSAGDRRLDSPAAKQALAKFATCMHDSGVNVPAPNTSGKGPIFNTKGLNTNSAAFKAAETKCLGDLHGASGAHPGAAGAPPGAAGAPGAAGEPGAPSTAG